MSQDYKTVRVPLEPGFNQITTAYGIGPQWFSGDKVRFKNRELEKIGGWTNYTTDETNVTTPWANFHGTVRKLFVWSDLNGKPLIGMGSHQGVYLVAENKLYNITPITTVVSAVSCFMGWGAFGTNALVSLGSPLNGLGTFSGSPGDIIYFKGVTSLEIASVLDISSSYEGAASIARVSATRLQVEKRTTQTFTPEKNPGNPADGNEKAEWIALHISSGKESNEAISGWGAGTWGSGTWGVGAGSGGVLDNIRLWSMDSWGEDLLFSYKDGPLYYKDITNLESRGTLVSQAPQRIRFIIVSDQRHVIACGTCAFSSAYDPLLVRWSDREDYTDWIPSVSNQSGEVRINSGTKLIGAVKSKQELILWTDEGAHSMRFIGGTDVFAFERLGTNCGLIGQNAAVALNGVAYWMSQGSFYVYNGVVNKLECTLEKYIFDRINLDQKDKVYAGVNIEFDEVIWFYPNTSVDNPIENNAYIIYNYKDNLWYNGNLSRTAWIDATGTFAKPLAVQSSVRAFYNQEAGYNAVTAIVTASARTGFFAWDEGDQTIHIDRLMPDFCGRLHGANGQTDVYIDCRMYPNGSIVRKGPYTFGRSLGSYMKRVRARGKEFRLVLKHKQLDTCFGLGPVRAGVIQDGTR